MTQEIINELAELKQATATQVIASMSRKGYDGMAVAYALEDLVAAGKLRVSGSCQLSVR